MWCVRVGVKVALIFSGSVVCGRITVVGMYL